MKRIAQIPYPIEPPIQRLDQCVREQDVDDCDDNRYCDTDKQNGY